MHAHTHTHRHTYTHTGARTRIQTHTDAYARARAHTQPCKGPETEQLLHWFYNKANKAKKAALLAMLLCNACLRELVHPLSIFLQSISRGQQLMRMVRLTQANL